MMKTKSLFTINHKQFFGFVKYMFIVKYMCYYYSAICFFSKIGNFQSPICDFESKSLDENYYENQKTNLYIVLDYEKIKFVFDTFKSNDPTTDATDKIKIKYLNWKKANTLLQC